MMRTNMISLLMGIIYDLAKEDNPDADRIHMTVDSDGYKNITGYRTIGLDPDEIDVAFNAYTFDGSEWRVEQVEADDGTDP